MATGVTEIRGHPFTGDVKVYKWVLTANETGDKVIVPRHSDKTVHLFGTFGGTVTIEGGLNPDEAAVDFFTLSDPLGNSLSFTADDLQAVLQNVYTIGPKAGAGITSVTVFLMVR